MPKPTSLFGWISSGNAITDPSTTRKTAGYGVRGKLPNSHMNWILTTLTAWIDGYLNVFEDEIHEWGDTQTFKSWIELGTDLLGSVAEALQNRALFVLPELSVSEWAGLWTAVIDTVSGAGRVRALTSVSGSNVGLNYNLTLNARRRTDGKWEKDNNAAAAVLLRMNLAGEFIVAVKPAAEDTPWDDTFGNLTDWHNQLLFLDGTTPSIKGILQLTNFTSIGGSITGSFSVENVLLSLGSIVALGTTTLASLTLDGFSVPKKLVPKAWAVIHVDDALSGDVEVVDGQNIASVSLVTFGSYKVILVTFAAAMADPNYSVVATTGPIVTPGLAEGGGGIAAVVPQVLAKTAGTFKLALIESGSGNSVDISPPFIHEGYYNVTVMGVEA